MPRSRQTADRRRSPAGDRHDGRHPLQDLRAARLSGLTRSRGRKTASSSRATRSNGAGSLSSKVTLKLIQRLLPICDHGRLAPGALGQAGRHQAVDLIVIRYPCAYRLTGAACRLAGRRRHRLVERLVLEGLSLASWLASPSAGDGAQQISSSRISTLRSAPIASATS